MTTIKELFFSLFALIVSSLHAPFHGAAAGIVLYSETPKGIYLLPIMDILQNPIPLENPAYRERGPYAWIPYSQIEPFLEFSPASRPSKERIDPRYLPPDRRTDWIWPVWLHNLRGAFQAKALPWMNKTIRHKSIVSPPLAH